MVHYKENKSLRRTVIFEDPTIYYKLKERAYGQGMTVAKLMNKIVNDYLRNNEKMSS